MNTSKRKGPWAAAIVGGALVAFVVVPSIMSVSSGDGSVCFTDSACELSAINPCVRTPAFAVVGRCAVSIK